MILDPRTAIDLVTNSSLGSCEKSNEWEITFPLSIWKDFDVLWKHFVIFENHMETHIEKHGLLLKLKCKKWLLQLSDSKQVHVCAYLHVNDACLVLRNLGCSIMER